MLTIHIRWGFGSYKFEYIDRRKHHGRSFAEQLLQLLDDFGLLVVFLL